MNNVSGPKNIFKNILKDVMKVNQINSVFSGTRIVMLLTFQEVTKINSKANI